MHKTTKLKQLQVANKEAETMIFAVHREALVMMDLLAVLVFLDSR